MNNPPPPTTKVQTPLDLDAIRERVGKATPGQWATMRYWPLYIVPAEQAGFTLGASVDPKEDSRLYAQEIAVVSRDEWCSPEFTHRRTDLEQAKADAQFIAHSREDVPALIREVERLRSEIHQLREAHKYG